MVSRKSSRTGTRRSKTGRSTTRKSTAKKSISRSTAPKRTSKTLSATRSRTARTQRRHSDGTFAKGFKKTTTPKKNTSSTKKTTSARTTTSSPSKKSTTSKSKTTVKKSMTGRPRGRPKKGYTPKMCAAEKAFDFKCADSTKEKVIETVANNFTKDEIEKISKNGKPVVNNDQTVTTDGKSAYSRSTSRNDGKIPVISFPRKPEESSVTHEVIHHLKAVDKDRAGFAKTAYPVDNNGTTKCDKILDKKTYNQVRNAEETTTVAETEIRTKTKGGFLSKYWKIDKHMVDGREIRDKDRKTMRKTSTRLVEDGKNVIGEKATEMVNENYPKTLVSSRKVENESALMTFKRIFDKRRKHKW